MSEQTLCHVKLVAHVAEGRQIVVETCRLLELVRHVLHMLIVHDNDVFDLTKIIKRECCFLIAVQHSNQNHRILF